MLQIKEHGKNPQEQLNEKKIDNLAEKEFMRIHESKDDSRSQKQMELWIEKMQEKFNKDLGELKTNRDEQDNNQSEKCTKGIYSRTTETEEWTSNLEDRMMEISTVEQNKEKRMKRNENSIREL